MFVKTLAACVATALVFSGAACAEEKDLTPAVAELLKLKASDIEVHRLSKGALYEVIYKPAKEILYVDQSLHYIIQGSVMDAATAANLTQQRREEITAIDFTKLPMDKAIKIVHGDGSRHVAVFEDPDCPFCKKLEHDIVGVDNVTIHLFLFPITQLHPKAAEHARNIACADDPAKAWYDYMQTGTEPAAKQCATAIADIAKVAGEIGVTGTPTLVFEDGHVNSGALPLMALEGKLNAARQRVADAKKAQDAPARQN